MPQKIRKNNRKVALVSLYELETGRPISNPNDKTIALQLDDLLRAVVAVQGGLK